MGKQRRHSVRFKSHVAQTHQRLPAAQAGERAGLRMLLTGPDRGAARDLVRDHRVGRRPQVARDQRRPDALRRVPDPDAHAEAAAVRVPGHGRAGPRPLQRQMDGCRVHVPVQHIRPAGAVAAPALVGGRAADGGQRVGRYGNEATLLRVATVLEQELPWRDRRPPVWTS